MDSHEVGDMDCSRNEVSYEQQREGVSISNIQSFLLAGFGSQACQEQ